MSVRRQTFSAVLASLLLATALRGQEESFATTAIDSKPERKRPSVFHRPEEDSPAAQLAYAARLHVEGKLKPAGKQYLALVHHWHDSPEAARAQLAYAEILFARELHERAFRELQYLIDHYTGQFPHDRALKHQMDIAQCVRTRKRGKFLFYSGFTAPERALPLFARIVENAPNWEKAPEAQFCQGTIQEEIGEYSLAVAAYELLLNRYPRNEHAVQAKLRRAVCLWALSNQAPRDEQRCRTALGALESFLNEHPDEPGAADAGEKLAALRARFAGLVYEQAVFYDRAARRPDAALVAYREFLKRFAWSPLAGGARERIRELEQEQEARNAE